MEKYRKRLQLVKLALTHSSPEHVAKWNYMGNSGYKFTLAHMVSNVDVFAVNAVVAARAGRGAITDCAERRAVAAACGVGARVEPSAVA